MAKTLRILFAPGFTTKGNTLTYEELDQNFIDLYEGKIGPDDLVQIVDPLSEDEAVTGKAVADWVFPKRGPFAEDATLNNAKFLYDAIKKVEIYNADPSVEYHVSQIDRNFTGTTAQLWGIQITDGTNVMQWIEEDYTEPSGIDEVTLNGLGDFDAQAKVWIDWSQIQNNSRYENLSNAETVLDAYTYVNNKVADFASGDDWSTPTINAVTSYIETNVKGLKINSGVKAPFIGPETLKPGETAGARARNVNILYNVILDLQIFGKRQGYEYRLDFAGNNHVIWGDLILISELDSNGNKTGDLFYAKNVTLNVDRTKPQVVTFTSDTYDMQVVAVVDYSQSPDGSYFAGDGYGGTGGDWSLDERISDAGGSYKRLISDFTAAPLKNEGNVLQNNNESIDVAELRTTVKAIVDAKIYVNTEVNRDDEYYIKNLRYNGANPATIVIGIARVRDESLVCFLSRGSFFATGTTTIHVPEYQGSGITTELTINMDEFVNYSVPYIKKIGLGGENPLQRSGEENYTVKAVLYKSGSVPDGMLINIVDKNGAQVALFRETTFTGSGVERIQLHETSGSGVSFFMDIDFDALGSSHNANDINESVIPTITNSGIQNFDTNNLAFLPTVTKFASTQEESGLTPPNKLKATLVSGAVHPKRVDILSKYGNQQLRVSFGRYGQNGMYGLTDISLYDADGVFIENFDNGSTLR